MNEAVRWGMTTTDMAELAALISHGLDDPHATAADVSAFRSRFTNLHFLAPNSQLHSKT